MRPTRLELEGFASFRQRTELDFGDDLDLFVFAGPTGSGKCLPAGTRIYDGKTGRAVALGEAVRARLDTVLGLTDGQVVPVPVVDWHELGVHDLLRVHLDGGGRLVGARSHPVLTSRGVVRLEDLRPDDLVAEARRLRCDPPARATAAEARHLAEQLATDPAAGGLPPELLLQPPRVAAGLLSGLVAAGGRWEHPEHPDQPGGTAPRLHLPLPSEPLARDVRVVARSLGVVADLCRSGGPEAGPWELVVAGRDLRRLLELLELAGGAAEQASELARELEPVPEPSGRGDVIWRGVQRRERAGRSPCFDLTVGTDEQLYVAGLTVVHNSSLLDAVCFSLYGSVPRYPNRNWVAPVVSQGANQARVRLTFQLGEQRFAATRVVRRTASGASTKEARLERLGDGQVVETLAGSAAEVTDSVEALLGLSFEHFVRTVVLPQGAFQEFMHARPKERQDLLVELLGLDVYRRVASAARARAREAEQTAELLQGRLEGELSGATEEAEQAAAARVATLEELAGRVAGAQPELERLQDERRRLAEEAAAARDRAELLAGLHAPDGVAELAAERAEAVAERDAAREALEEAVADREEAEQALEALPDAAAVSAVRRLQADAAQLAERLDAAATERDDAQQRQQAAGEDLEAREQELAEARGALEHARQRDLAATLAEGLGVGDDCPVCDRPLQEAPDHHEVADLEAARDQLQQARETAERARKQARSTEAAAVQARTQHEELAARREELAEQLEQARAGLAAAADGKLGSGDTDGHTQLDELEEALEQAEQRLGAARRAEKAARQRLRRAGTAVEDLAADHRRAWERFDQTRDALGGLEPPAADRDDLAGSWSALVAWADERRPELAKEAGEAEAAAAEARDEHQRLSARLRRTCRALQVEVGERPVGEAVAAALEQARGRLRRISEQLERIEEIREEVDEHRRRAQIAGDLGRHLSARNFERWLLNRALRQLVVGATGILRELTQGAYSLALDDSNQFEVVDHRSAGMTRSARTLSGGETFLASLALALALSEHVAELAAGSAARLDALFLDEGFGTLDAATLDTVAAAVEELGARGRMVGLITHVRDLAERIPVRFEVRKTAAGSRVEKVIT